MQGGTVRRGFAGSFLLRVRILSSEHCFIGYKLLSATTSLYTSACHYAYLTAVHVRYSRTLQFVLIICVCTCAHFIFTSTSELAALSCC